ncbi:unnamed protein product [Malus baccata var. baccata]
MNTRNEDDGALYVGALIFVMIINMFNGFAELSLTISRLPVFYKHRDLLFHPAWTFTLPSVLLGIPISIMETTIWMAITYYTIGFAPEASRYDTFPQAIISEEAANKMEVDQEESKEEPRLRRPPSKKDFQSRSLSSNDGNNSSKKPNIFVNCNEKWKSGEWAVDPALLD